MFESIYFTAHNYLAEILSNKLSLSEKNNYLSEIIAIQLVPHLSLILPEKCMRLHPWFEFVMNLKLVWNNYINSK